MTTRANGSATAANSVYYNILFFDIKAGISLHVNFVHLFFSIYSPYTTRRSLDIKDAECHLLYFINFIIVNKKKEKYIFLITLNTKYLKIIYTKFKLY